MNNFAHKEFLIYKSYGNLAISRRSYGYDLREAQMSPYYTDAYLKLKQEVLGK